MKKLFAALFALFLAFTVLPSSAAPPGKAGEISAEKKASNAPKAKTNKAKNSNNVKGKTKKKASTNQNKSDKASNRSNAGAKAGQSKEQINSKNVKGKTGKKASTKLNKSDNAYIGGHVMPPLPEPLAYNQGKNTAK